MSLFFQVVICVFTLLCIIFFICLFAKASKEEYEAYKNKKEHEKQNYYDIWKKLDSLERGLDNLKEQK